MSVFQLCSILKLYWFSKLVIKCCILYWKWCLTFYDLLHLHRTTMHVLDKELYWPDVRNTCKTLPTHHKSQKWSRRNPKYWNTTNLKKLASYLHPLVCIFSQFLLYTSSHYELQAVCCKMLNCSFSKKGSNYLPLAK